MLSDVFDFLWPLLIYILVACAVYLYRVKKSNSQYKSLISYCFPLNCYWTKSAKIDVLIYLVNGLVSPLFLVLWGLLIYLVQFDNKFLITSGTLPFRELEFSWSIILIAAVIFIIIDGVNSIQHFLFHRIPFLWEFHKVHHSATALNLFTAFRHHPVLTVITSLMSQLTILVLILLFEFLFGTSVNKVMVWAVVNLFGVVLKPLDMLKHTHVWISLGWLDYVLQSPAMHQMHHSDEPKFHHKNFAGFFSFWDLMLGTFYIPESGQELVCGLKKSSLGKKHLDTFRGCIWDPFIRRV